MDDFKKRYNLTDDELDILKQLDNEDQQLSFCFKYNKTKLLVKKLFDFTITKGQKEIIDNIVFSDKKRLAISCYTRYGKTRSVAISILLYILLNKNKSVMIIAPQNSQAKKMRDYIGDLIVTSPLLQDLTQINASGIERLEKEATKKHITFKNGSEIFVRSAQGEAERLMGEGASGLLVIDESCLIDEDVYTSKITRMLGDHPDSKEIQISNPWHKGNHFYQAWESDDYYNIHVDYKQGLKEGRITKEYIEEQKNKLTKNEFKVMYESLFPEEREMGIIRYGWINRAIKQDFDLAESEIIHGLDVAEKGSDLTILTTAEVKDNRYKIIDIQRINKDETMEIANKVMDKISKKEEIHIDSIGVGAGVDSRLKEKGYNNIGIRVSKNAKSVYKDDDLDPDRFLNQKAQHYWRLRNLFENNNIDIPENRKLKKQLGNLTYEKRGKGNIKIEDMENSPDYADSLMLCCAKSKNSDPFIAEAKSPFSSDTNIKNIRGGSHR